MQTIAENIRIVLVRTFHAGNIGSAARALKTMGLDKLCLVAPRDFPSQEASKMAAGAEDVLANAIEFPDLASAVADCSVVVATSARPRGYELPQLTPTAAARLLVDHAASTPVALVFGPERMGLHNEDLALARYRLQIPANPVYSSLNLAAAVQIMTYELFTASAKPVAAIHQPATELPTTEDLERLHTHLENVLRQIRFLRPHEGETLMRLRNFIARAEPSVTDVNILRGILTAIEKNAPS